MAPRILANPLHGLRPILHVPCPGTTRSCSKGSRGLSVPSRVPGIFTGTTISPSSWSRQCPDRYTIRAGRNLPDKEFRYLRTVIVTAAVYRGFNSSLLLRLALLLTFRHRAGVRLYTSSLNFAQPCVFVKQLPGPILCALPSPGRDPLSRSYRVNLPSSLTVNHSSASVFSTRPRVSVYGTGAAWISLADFLGSMVTSILRCASAPYTLRFDSPRGFAYGNQYLHPSTGYSVSRQDCHFSVSTSLHEAVWEY